MRLILDAKAFIFMANSKKTIFYLVSRTDARLTIRKQKNR
jgi:hypothetical protein